MELVSIPLVNWNMGVILIAIFAVVCITLVIIVYKMAQGDKKKEDSSNP